MASYPPSTHLLPTLIHKLLPAGSIPIPHSISVSCFIMITLSFLSLRPSSIIPSPYPSPLIFSPSLVQCAAFTAVGTPYYLSPELCDGLPYNDKVGLIHSTHAFQCITR